MGKILSSYRNGGLWFIFVFLGFLKLILRETVFLSYLSLFPYLLAAQWSQRLLDNFLYSSQLTAWGKAFIQKETQYGNVILGM